MSIVFCQSSTYPNGLSFVQMSYSSTTITNHQGPGILRSFSNLTHHRVIQQHWAMFLSLRSSHTGTSHLAPRIFFVDRTHTLRVRWGRSYLSDSDLLGPIFYPLPESTFFTSRSTLLHGRTSISLSNLRVDSLTSCSSPILRESPASTGSFSNFTFFTFTLHRTSINLAFILHRRWLIGDGFSTFMRDHAPSSAHPPVPSSMFVIGEYLNGAPPSSVALSIDALSTIHLASLTLPASFTRKLHAWFVLWFSIDMLRHSRHFFTVRATSVLESTCLA